MDNSSLPPVSIIVIGHNENSNLEFCFKAIYELNYPKEKIEIIYVDSKSTDNSVDIARKYTNKVFVENSHWPTAGEAFNRGIVESSYDLVHITAGDIQLQKDYLLNAVKTLISRNDIQAVTGYFIEKNKKGWNKFLAFRREEDIETNDHYVSTPNGGTFWKMALVTLNGYDERIKKGQETELGQRFAKAGYKIWYMHIPQGVHDFDVNTIQDMIKRYVDNGVSFGHLFVLSFFEKDNEYVKPYLKTIFVRILHYSTLIFFILLFLFFRMPIISLLLISGYLLSIPIYVMVKQRKKTMNYKKYFMVNMLFSFFVYYGIIKFFFIVLIFQLKGIRLIGPRQGLAIKNKTA